MFNILPKYFLRTENPGNPYSTYKHVIVSFSSLESKIHIFCVSKNHSTSNVLIFFIIIFVFNAEYILTLRLAKIANKWKKRFKRKIPLLTATAFIDHEDSPLSLKIPEFYLLSTPNIAVNSFPKEGCKMKWPFWQYGFQPSDTNILMGKVVCLVYPT